MERARDSDVVSRITHSQRYTYDPTILRGNKDKRMLTLELVWLLSSFSCYVNPTGSCPKVFFCSRLTILLPVPSTNVMTSKIAEHELDNEEGGGRWHNSYFYTGNHPLISSY